MVWFGIGFWFGVLVDLGWISLVLSLDFDLVLMLRVWVVFVFGWFW